MDEYAILNKALYGLKHASHAFFEEMSETLEGPGLKFKRYQSNFCLFKTKYVLIGLYFDDLLVCGQERNVETFVRIFGKK